jgi:hypothetical protein
MRDAGPASNGTDKPWDARLVEWMSRGANEPKPRSRGADLLLALPSGAAAGRLVAGEWWWFAALLAGSTVVRLVRRRRKRGTRVATASKAR